MRFRSLAIVLATGASLACGAEYHVSVLGNDSNRGTQDLPLRSVQKAAGMMVAGDTCIVHEGTYCETVRPAASGTAEQPLRFVAADGERVVISGADEVSGQWSVHSGRIHRIPLSGECAQLFLDGTMMPEARWPNTPIERILPMECARAGEGTDYTRLADVALPEGDWNGALVLIQPGSRWNNATRRIANYKAGQGFTFDPPFKVTDDKYHKSDPYKPKAGNPYVIFGSLAGLDMPGEWFFDRTGQVLYVWAPDGRSPADHHVAVKRRTTAFDLKERSCVQVVGVSVRGAGIDMTNATDCLIENCDLAYVDHFRECDGYRIPPPANTVSGSGNVWRRCRIAYSAGHGIRITGTGNRLENCIVHDTDYTGGKAGAIDIGNSDGTVITHCSVFRTGRGLIELGRSRRIRIEYNDLHHGNMLSNDTGATYCWKTDGQGSIIAYNWVHDNGGNGVYLDNFSSNFLVHHNVIWQCSGTGVRLNSDATNHLVCNNTITRVGEPFGTYTYYNYEPTMKDTRIVNNLVLTRFDPSDPHSVVQGRLGPELRNNTYGAVGANGMPTKGSGAIDAGIEVPGVTDGFAGKAPDVGAYEWGAAYWRPGADWGEVGTEIDIAFKPRAPVTADDMIRDRLQLWLDAAEQASLTMSADAGIAGWRDKSDARRAITVGKGFTFVHGGLNGKPVVRASGEGNIRIGTIRREKGPLTLFLVSQNASPAGGNWQRLFGAYSGQGKEWIAPNWAVLRPQPERPESYQPRIFHRQASGGLVLDRVTLCGAPHGNTQYLAGDIAEVLLYDRNLRFDEVNAIEMYLKKKWGLD